jgi:hypothetical protein
LLFNLFARSVPVFLPLSLSLSLSLSRPYTIFSSGFLFPASLSTSASFRQFEHGTNSQKSVKELLPFCTQRSCVYFHHDLFNDHQDRLADDPMSERRFTKPFFTFFTFFFSLFESYQDVSAINGEIESLRLTREID